MGRGKHKATNRQMQALSVLERAINACVLVSEANAAVTCTISLASIATQVQRDDGKAVHRTHVQQLFAVLRRHGYLIWTPGNNDYRITEDGIIALERWRAGQPGWRSVEVLQ
jgi:hypothetical protein